MAEAAGVGLEAEADLAAAAGERALGAVAWDHILWAVNDVLSTSLYIHVAQGLVELLAISESPSTDVGIFCIPSAASLHFPACSPQLTVNGIDHSDGDLEIEVHLVIFRREDVEHFYSGPPLGIGDGYEAEPIAFPGVPFPGALTAALVIPEVAQWLQGEGLTVGAEGLLIAGGMETAESGGGEAPGTAPPGLQKIMANAAQLASGSLRSAPKQASKAMAAALKPGTPGGPGTRRGPALAGDGGAKKAKAPSNADLADALTKLTTLVTSLEQKVNQSEGRQPPAFGQAGGAAGPKAQVMPGFAAPPQRRTHIPQQGQSQLPSAGSHMHAGFLPAQGQEGGPDLASALAAAMRQALRPDGDLLGDGEGDRSAKGTVAVQKLVSEVRNQPDRAIAAFDLRIMDELGIYFEGQPWSLSQHSRMVCENTQGHRVLKRCLVMMSHLYDLAKVERAPSRLTASVGQFYKVLNETVINQGSWELSWPLSGLPDPDERIRSTASAAERVALVALAKEKKLLREAVAAHPGPKEYQGTGKPPKGGGKASGGAGGSGGADGGKDGKEE